MAAIVFDTVKKRYRYKHEIEDICQVETAEGYNHFVRAWLAMQADKGDRYAQSILDSYVPMSELDFNRLKAKCEADPVSGAPPTADFSVLIDPSVAGRVGSAGAPPTADFSVFIDPSITGRVGLTPEEEAAMSMPSEKAYADALERQAEMEKQLMEQQAMKQKLEEEKKRNKMILYGGIGVAALGLGFMVYNALKPQKRQRRRRRR